MAEPCAHVSDPGDRFCRRCGAALEQSSPVHEPEEHTFIGTAGPQTTGSLPAVGSGFMPGLDEGASVLVVRRGLGEGTTYLLTGDLVSAGRAPESDLFLDDVTVSRRHAEFRHLDGQWHLVDTESLNGTYVNRQRVEDEVLSPGDEVQIGKYRFVYLVGGNPGIPR